MLKCACRLHPPLYQKETSLLSVADQHVIRQCLSLLPLSDFAAPILDYRKQLLTVNMLKIFMTAQLAGWPSLSYIEHAIRADEHLQAEFGVASIHKSQLSRRINSLPVEVTSALFQAVVARIRSHAFVGHPQPLSIGKPLAVVDSTNIRLPFQLGAWAQVTKQRSGVKVHTRLLVVNDNMQYPDHVLPSTGNVSDYEGSDPLVVSPDVLYVMDRGYVCYKRMERWVSNQIDFVIRVNTHHYAEIVEEHPVPETNAFIRRDATVRMGNNPNTAMESHLRLIEFVDEKNRFYRLVTTRWDLPAHELTEIYRQRWLIELFFKWIKQHLKVARLYSHQPDAVWNHIFLALAAYGLTCLIKAETQTPKATYRVLELIRIYAHRAWSSFMNELTRAPSRPSKGRQKRRIPPASVVAIPTEGIHVKPSKRKKKK